MKFRCFFTLALSCLLVSGVVGQEKPLPSKEDKKKVDKALTPKLESIKELRGKASDITSKMGEIISSGKLTTNDETVELLKNLVQELSQVNEQLKKMQGEIEEIKGWIEGQNEALPIISKNIDQLKRFKNGTYLQFQWTDSQNNAGTPRPNDGFNVRRARFSHTGTIDPKTYYKLSADFATGAQRSTLELKDLQLFYDVIPSTEKVGLLVIAGQMPMPLGYELERSSTLREFPERTTYNNRLFAGERNRGVMLKYGLDEKTSVHAGIWDALTTSDPQQSNVNTYRNLSGTKPGGHIGLRYDTKEYNVGLSYFTAYRPSLTYSTGNPAANVTTDSGQREFLYLDAAWIINTEWSIRGEMMVGNDRNPAFTGSGATLSTDSSFSRKRGSQLQISNKLNYRNTLTARYEFFDPNSRANDNVFGYGLAWAYMINPGAKLTFAHEIFQEQGFDTTNNVTTIRIQFKF